MNKQAVLKDLVSIVCPLYGGIWDTVKSGGKTTVGGGSSAIDWTKGTVDSSGCKFI